MSVTLALICSPHASQDPHLTPYPNPDAYPNPIEGEAAEFYTRSDSSRLGPNRVKIRVEFWYVKQGSPIGRSMVQGLRPGPNPHTLTRILILTVLTVTLTLISGLMPKVPFLVLK